jgi:hypothetical protein
MQYLCIYCDGGGRASTSRCEERRVAGVHGGDGVSFGHGVSELLVEDHAWERVSVGCVCTYVCVRVCICVSVCMCVEYGVRVKYAM